ncbi:tyrosine-type recombinase/integrase [Microtetraspora malaysiensis]|uniref:Tyrosine-type recombinase/integrase n=1 Tax=Microtetraspora malaysiensis TaxID=161358 RepID=A0ABW6SKF9_9ACTN
MKASYSKRCGCIDPDTSKRLDAACPQLKSRRHGTYGFTTRIDTTKVRGRQLKRFGFSTQRAAEEAFKHVEGLIDLARDDQGMREKIGDLIAACKRGTPLPDVEEVRRKLRLDMELAASGGTVAELLEDWHASKRGAKASSHRTWRTHMDLYLIPQLGDIPRDRLRAARIDSVFDTIEEWNDEIETAKKERRRPYLPGDIRKRHKIVRVNTQHHILKTLRTAFNWAVKRRMIEFNPCHGVELPPVEREPARVWSPEQVMTFLTASADDPLGLLYRLALLRGLRRGEACGIRWQDIDLDAGHMQIQQQIQQLGSEIVIDTPKTRAGRRTVSLDQETTDMLAARKAEQRRVRFAAGADYEDHDLVWAEPNGRPLTPGRVSDGFKQLARAAGLPVIKLHEARHTAASLALEAGLHAKIVSEQLGHANTQITLNLYTHVRQALHDEAAERVLTLVQRRPASGAKEA